MPSATPARVTLAVALGTVLTAGGVATVVYTAVSLLGVVRDPVPAVVFALTGIIGSVLIGGGIYLLHLPDSHQFFIK